MQRLNLVLWHNLGVESDYHIYQQATALPPQETPYVDWIHPTVSHRMDELDVRSPHHQQRILICAWILHYFYHQALPVLLSNTFVCKSIDCIWTAVLRGGRFGKFSLGLKQPLLIIKYLYCCCSFHAWIAYKVWPNFSLHLVEKCQKISTTIWSSSFPPLWRTSMAPAQTRWWASV